MKKNSPLLLFVLFFFVFSQNGMGQPSSLLTRIVSYWTLDETTGNAIDVAGGGNTGTLTSVTQGVTGKISNAYSFNGTSSKINMGNPSNLSLSTSGTVSAWVYMPSLSMGHDGLVVGKGNWSGDRNGYLIVYYNSSKTFVAELANGTSAQAINFSGVTISANTWYHLVLTWDGTSMILYVNGGNANTRAETVIPVSNVSNFGIGQSLINGAHDFLGTIDEVGVWNRALTAAEVASLYNSGAGKQYPFSSSGVNIPPVANAGPNQNLPAGTSSTTLSGSGTDADGTVVSYLWTPPDIPGGGPVITTPNNATTTVTGLYSGNTYTFTLKVTDNQGATGTSTMTVTVVPGGPVWSTTGNPGMIDGTNFIGTTDNVPFNIRVNNLTAGKIDPNFENTFYGLGAGVSYPLDWLSENGANTAVGYEALSSVSRGGNTAVGVNALHSAGWAEDNTAVGIYALGSVNTCNYNTAVGPGALGSLVNSNGNNGNADGENCAIGDVALGGLTQGDNNTAMGSRALVSNITGSYNTALGFWADMNADGYTNSTAIGNQALITGSNQVVLGNSSVTEVNAYVTGLTNLSDRRFKKNIKENVPGLEFINLLKPVTYNYDIKAFNAKIKGTIPSLQNIAIDSPSVKGISKLHALKPPKMDEASIAQKEKIEYTGLVAQEVETAANKVGYDFSGLHKPANDKDTYGLNYTDFVVPLIKSVQELSTLNEALQKQNELQQQINNDLQNQLNELKIKLESLVKGGVSGSNTILSSAKLEQNIPNPFNQTTLINYYVPGTAGHAFIKVAGINGEAIKTIQLNGKGSGQVTLQTATLASGNYTYSLYVDGNLIDTKVMVLAR